MSAKNILEQEELQVIAFKLEKEEYAVIITSVQEIIMPQEKTKIPRSPAFVEGVINLRGNIIPIIDGRKRFGFECIEETPETRIIILELENNKVGLVVDSVSEVIHMQTKDVQPSPMNLDNSQDFIIGIGKYKDRLLILLDPDQFLDMHEAESMTNLAKVAENLSEITTLTEIEKSK